jgi:hypothetical protein
MTAIPYAGRTYVVNNLAVTISTAITIIQIKAGATWPLWLVRATLTQKGSTTSAQERVQILRKTAAATVTSATALLYDGDDIAAKAVGGTTSTGITATGEGTDGDVLVDRGFNVLNGFEWVATSFDSILVPAAGFIALKFPTAPASQVWSAQMYFVEL